MDETSACYNLCHEACGVRYLNTTFVLPRLEHTIVKESFKNAVNC